MNSNCPNGHLSNSTEKFCGDCGAPIQTITDAATMIESSSPFNSRKHLLIKIGIPLIVLALVCMVLLTTQSSSKNQVSTSLTTNGSIDSGVSSPSPTIIPDAGNSGNAPCVAAGQCAPPQSTTDVSSPTSTSFIENTTTTIPQKINVSPTTTVVSKSELKNKLATTMNNVNGIMSSLNYGDSYSDLIKSLSGIADLSMSIYKLDQSNFCKIIPSLVGNVISQLQTFSQMSKSSTQNSFWSPTGDWSTFSTYVGYCSTGY